MKDKLKKEINQKIDHKEHEMVTDNNEKTNNTGRSQNFDKKVTTPKVTKTKPSITFSSDKPTYNVNILETSS